MASLLARLGAEAGLERTEGRMPGWFQRKEDPQIGLLCGAIRDLASQVHGLKLSIDESKLSGSGAGQKEDEEAANEKRIEASHAKADVINAAGQATADVINAKYYAKLAKEEADREREKTDPAFKKQRDKEWREEHEAEQRRKKEEREYGKAPQYK
jgi:hypothetical protein